MQTRFDFVPASALPQGELFHPAVSGWLRARFGQATEVQSRAWAVTTQRRHALISAPTGSGKTLAAFVSAINDLVLDGLAGTLTDQVQVLYVSPLKALSNDIQKNLQEPLAGIRKALVELGHSDLAIRDAVRTGDTPMSERERMRREPPHILVTTPESLYILLSTDSGRRMMDNVRTVIVDELHAVAGSKRGAHLMLSLERLDALCATPPVRIGLSATVKPIEQMARYLVGGRDEQVAIIDTGHMRQRDIALEMPRSPLMAVMANEVWAEIYDRLAELVAQHRTTLIFVNQRRIAERAARHLAERIGEEYVTAHHGSLSREHRLKAEQRLKGGHLKALVATSSLELGIDIGDVDLVCQLGSPRAINAFLQRVGRAGHAVGAIPKGRLFPLSLDDLLESAALLDAVAQGQLDRIRVPQGALDVLAQQIVAECACREWGVEELHQRYTRAEPYRELTLADFENVVQMLAEGYSTRRGRRGAYLHYDAVNRVIRSRRGAKITAVTNAGVIPDQFDCDVVLLPEELRIGTIGEDFAFESIPGDIFQLGNNAYRIAKVETGKVYVEDAKGQPPNLPFWFGDALGRSDELSVVVSQLNQHAQEQLLDGVEALEQWLRETLALPATAAMQLTQYLAASQAALGVLPNEDCIIFERFFDEVGDSHLVIHSPFGSRINKAWGLALRKRFCRKFNFELQASALEDSIILSLGPTHSFPLIEVKDYLKSTNVREVLIQALLDAPMFATRFRWNATNALAIKRMHNGKRIPPQFQRSDAEDLLTVVFPDQVACAENLSGPREIPDHPLVRQTIHDCLHETMDIAGLERLLARIERGEVAIRTCDLTSPSPLSHAIINARPYAILDGGEAEERRTRNVRTQPLMDVQSAGGLARLAPEAIAQVREEAWPVIDSADELHDALVVHGYMTLAELEPASNAVVAEESSLSLWERARVRAAAQPPSSAPSGHLLPYEARDLVPEGEGTAKQESVPLRPAAVAQWLTQLEQQQRITRAEPQPGMPLYFAAERLHEALAALPQITSTIASVSADRPSPDIALRELLRSRMELLGPVTEALLGEPLNAAVADVHVALLQLEAEGAVMRGAYTSPDSEEWCERRLLARMHRYSRERRRAEIKPVAPAQFLRHLFRWQRLDLGTQDERREGDSGLVAALRQLEGYAAPASAWEEDLLPARVKDYQPYMLDKLCAAGRVVWYRPPSGGEDGKRKAGPVRATPILLSERETLMHWQQTAEAASEAPLSPRAQSALEALRLHGASFLSDLQHDTGLLGGELELALGELVAQGLVHCDSWAGLRALVMPAEKRNRLRRRYPQGMAGIDQAGRWSQVRQRRAAGDNAAALAEPHVEHIARVLLRRYGVVFRKLLEREEGLPPWRELFYVYRRLEARGEVRGGRFVSGFAGEQFALPEAATALRTATTEGEERVSISAADPLNLAGILTPGEKVPRLAGNRLLFENGVPLAVQSGGEVRYLQALDSAREWEVKNLLVRRQKPGSYLPPPARPQ